MGDIRRSTIRQYMSGKISTLAKRKTRFYLEHLNNLQDPIYMFEKILNFAKRKVELYPKHLLIC